MTPDYRILITKMADELDQCHQLLMDDRRQRHPLADRARALLAAPVAEGPSADELIGLALRSEPWATWLRSGGCLESAHCELADLMLAVLALWGRPAAAPVPVSERLPGPEDCDAEGRCWLRYQMGSGTPTWLLGYSAWAERFPDVHRFWLPANALPLPAPEGGEVQP